MSTCLRFTYGGVDTDFDELEVVDVKRDIIQRSNIWQDLHEYYHLYKFGASYQRIVVTFVTQFNNTWTKLSTLWGYKDSYFQPAVIKLYYEYLISTSNNLQVQMKRDDFRFMFFGNECQGAEEIQLTFFETTPSGTALVL